MPTILTTSIFVHIPKTGGSWVEEILRQPKHKEFFVKNITSVPTLSEFIGTHKNKYTFAFVRHPLTWYKSLWLYLRGHRKHKTRMKKHISICNLFNNKSFPEFLKSILKTHPNGFMTKRIGEYADGLDFIGKQENLATDLISVLTSLDYKIDADYILNYPKVLVSKQRADKPGDLNYTPELVEAIMSTEKDYVEKYKYDYIPEGLI